MIRIHLILLCTFLFTGCQKDSKIILNGSSLSFKSFPSNDTLKFKVFSNEELDEPSKIEIYNNYLIIEKMNRTKEKWISLFSLDEKKVTKELIQYGQGPEEMLGCDIGLFNDKIWLYDITKKQIGIASADSFLTGENVKINTYKLDRHYYDIEMVNDSLLLGCNDLSNSSKITYTNIRTNQTFEKGEFYYLDNDISIEALKDAASSYINIHPVTNDIVLSYRYTDMVEFYDANGVLKHALHGPSGFDIEFEAKSRNNIGYMSKTNNTRKAFVNSYATGNFIYLLFSGCKRNEKGWSEGKEIQVYSWEGKPIKKYILEEPIYTFAVDEKNQIIYSYSLETSELIKSNM